LLAFAPNILSRLPRSGMWMQTMKVVLGLVELAAAMKFLSNADLVLRWGVVSRVVVLVVWLALALAAAVIVSGLVSRSKRHAPAVRSPWRWIAVALAL